MFSFSGALWTSRHPTVLLDDLMREVERHPPFGSCTSIPQREDRFVSELFHLDRDRRPWRCVLVRQGEQRDDRPTHLLLIDLDCNGRVKASTRECTTAAGRELREQLPTQLHQVAGLPVKTEHPCLSSRVLLT